MLLQPVRIEDWMDLKCLQALPDSRRGRVEPRRMHFNGVLRTIYVVHPQTLHGNGDPLLYLGAWVSRAEVRIGDVSFEVP